MTSFASQKPAEQPLSAIDWDRTEDDFAWGRGLLCALQPQEVLFHADEQKTDFYRVEAGVFLISTVADDGSLGVCRLAHPGDFLGLGFLSQHRSSATAMIASTVSCFSLSEFDEIALSSPDLRLQHAKAVQREFDHVRDACVARGVRSSPIQKVADLLVVISRLEEHEGRDPNLALDGLDCGFLAQLLSLDIESLSHSLKRLKILGLIDWDPEFGVRIADREHLEAFSHSARAAARYYTTSRDEARPQQ